MRNVSFLIILLTLLLLTLPAHAQYAQWADVRKGDDRPMFTTILGQNPEGVFVLRQNYRQRSRDISLERYDLDLKFLGAKPFLLRKEEFLLQILLQPTEIQLFYGFYNRETKSDDVIVKRLNWEFNETKPDSVLFSVPDKDLDLGFLLIEKPRNFNQILALYPSENTPSPSALQFVLLDENLKTLKRGNLATGATHPYTIESVAFTQERVCLLIQEKPPKKVQPEGFRFLLLDGLLADGGLGATRLYGDSFHVGEGLLKADYKNGHFAFGGFYALKDSSYTDGTAFWTKPFTVGDARRTFQPFSRRLLTDVAGRDYSTGGLHNLRLTDMALRHDGGLMLIGEEYRTSREVSPDLSMSGVAQNSLRQYYYYNNVLISSISPQGRAEWHKVLRKDQVSVNDGGMFSSYMLHATPHTLAFIYNDISRKRPALAMFLLKEDGASETKMLLKPQEYIGQLLPRDGGQAAQEYLYVPGYNNKGQTLLRVRIKD